METPTNPGRFSGNVPRTGGTYQLVVGAGTEEMTKHADTTALVDNNIPITRLDGDWTMPRTGAWTGSWWPRLFN
jgi:hypothetical protein